MIMSVIVALHRNHLSEVKSNRMSSISIKLRKNVSNNKFKSICFNSALLRVFKMSKKWCLRKNCTQLMKCELLKIISDKRFNLLIIFTFLKELSEKTHNSRIVINKTLIKINKTQKWLNIMKSLQCESESNSAYSTLIHRNVKSRDNKF